MLKGLVPPEAEKSLHGPQTVDLARCYTDLGAEV